MKLKVCYINTRLYINKQFYKSTSVYVLFENYIKVPTYLVGNKRPINYEGHCVNKKIMNQISKVGDIKRLSWIKDWDGGFVSISPLIYIHIGRIRCRST